jgi:hypothetical protein
MNEIRSRIEQTLAQIPGLRTQAGLSALHCTGEADLSEPSRDER